MNFGEASRLLILEMLQRQNKHKATYKELWLAFHYQTDRIGAMFIGQDATIDSCLKDFVDRKYATFDGSTYTVTPKGRKVLKSVRPDLQSWFKNFMTSDEATDQSE